MTRYSRWMQDKNRRETWDETVRRYIDFFVGQRGEDAKASYTLIKELEPAILNMQVMPSMRALMAAGPALMKENATGYNCAYIPCDDEEVFGETLHTLMCGTGMGFSCELSEVSQLPIIPTVIMRTDEVIVIGDHKEGWAEAFQALIDGLYDGAVPGFDFSEIRPEGAKLRTMGGRASGPEPLKKLFDTTTARFRKSAGYRLTPSAVHDIMCTIGEIVVVGGVRRSALISLSDLSDNMMANAKISFVVSSVELLSEDEHQKVYRIHMAKGQPTEPHYELTFDKDPSHESGIVEKQSYLYKSLTHKAAPGEVASAITVHWYVIEPQRALANNSVAYNSKPNAETFLAEWTSMVKSKTGERGFFNRQASQKQAAKYGRRSPDVKYGTNPCSEIILRPRQFCNLTEVVIRKEDNYTTIKAKVRLATILGTFQSTMTDFGYLSKKWTENTKQEALLGVSMTGIMDNRFMAGLASEQELRAFLFDPEYSGTPQEALIKFLDEMREYAVEVNREWAAILGVNPSAAITCVKPSGTVSQLCDTASGIHARHSEFYIRTVRLDKKDPVYQMMLSLGVPMEDDMMKPHATAIVSYAMKSPDGAITRNDMTALEQLELWLIYQRHWCEHKPSVTISVGEDEWLEVGAWVFKHFDELSGISFLPRSDHTYLQAPYQDKTGEELADWIIENPQPFVDWSVLPTFELDDQTVSSQTLACVAGGCEG